MSELEVVQEALPIIWTQEERDRVETYYAASRSESTRRNYSSQWKKWATWCDDRGIAPLPASPEALATWITEMAEAGTAVSTIDTALAAVWAKHDDLGIDSPKGHVALSRIRTGIAKTHGRAPRRQAHPLSVEELRRMVGVCERDGVRGARDKAVLLLGFAAALRRSELAGLNIENLTSRREGVAILLPHSKGDQEGKGAWASAAYGAKTSTCPVSALYAWIELLGDTSGPVFRTVTRHNSVPASSRPITGDTIDRIIQARAAEAGLGHLPISGHSLRAGHVTTCAENGIDPLRIMRTTRHRSVETVAIYARPLDALRDSTSRDLGL